MTHYGVSGNNIGSGSLLCRQIYLWENANLLGQQSKAQIERKGKNLGLVTYFLRQHWMCQVMLNVLYTVHGYELRIYNSNNALHL